MVILANAENNALLNRLAERLVQVGVETLGKGQAKADAKKQVDTPAEKVTE